MSTTESSSNHNNLENKSISELLFGMNQEDRSVPEAVAASLPQIEKLIAEIVSKMKDGGRLFYMGAGTSGRLGIVDASECPPTFGVDFGRVIGLIAGGDGAIRKAVEFAEDSEEQGWKDLQAHDISTNDVVVGIAASGRTPYVIGALKKCNEEGISTGCVVCNAGSAVAAVSKFPIEVVVGPEFVTGSTRLKSGTAQKLVLNMLTTCTFIQLGHVKGNKMVDMQLSNYKLVDRGTRMVMEETGLNAEEAKALLLKEGSVRFAVDSLKK
ncbi:MAG: N-acetylmuramic acid 6-phosphate etherase [Bacteroidota bacterium]|jgi:N-acetylmuramic acid 6-phosphate etherase